MEVSLHPEGPNIPQRTSYRQLREAQPNLAEGLILSYFFFSFLRIPITLCKILGDITANYRWFAIAYLIVMFILVPVIAMGVSLISDYLLYALLGKPKFISIIIKAV